MPRPDSGFIIGSGTGHVERNHALVLVPDIDHAVEFLVRALYGETGEKLGQYFSASKAASTFAVVS